MRFHHSTRRGRNSGRAERREPTSNTSRALLEGSRKWSQLTYCRESNIYFERSQLVAPPQRYQDTSGRKTLPSSRAPVLEVSAANNLSSAQQRFRLASSAGLAEVLDGNRDELATKYQRQDGVAPASLIGGESVANKRALDMEQVREKLLAQVEKRPFWSNKAARRMQLLDAQQRLIYIYELVSFCERRELKWHFEPNKGPSSGAAGAAVVAAAAAANANATASPDINRLCNSAHGSHEHALIHSRLIPARPLSATGLEQLQAQNQQQVSAFGRRLSSAPGAGARMKRNSVSCGRASEPNAELIWSIDAGFKPEPFVAHVVSSELPDTSFVKACHGCQGRGRLKCSSCDGVGFEVCLSCSGAGTTRSLSSAKSVGRSSDRGSTFNSSSSTKGGGGDSDSEGGGWKSSRSRKKTEWYSSSSNQSSAWATESCGSCHGSGQKKCWACSGRSYNSCPACRGAGSLRCYQTLNITWSNHRDELFLNNADNIISKDRLRLCSGQVLADQQAAHLEPLQLPVPPDGAGAGASVEQLDAEESAAAATEAAIQARQASQQLLDRHRLQHKSERLIRQRHKLTQIECHIVSYEWKQRRGHFVVYGQEHKVYIAKYPFKSICNIT